MYIKVKAITGSRVEKVIKKTEDHYVISVKEKAEANMANKRIIAILQDIFETKKIRIINGHRSPSKIFSIDLL